MMKVTIILAHPSRKSFNHAIAKTASQTLLSSGHKVYFHDLYRENFDPNLPEEEILKEGNVNSSIEKYCEELQASDGIIIIHPNWWGMPPAILKGWIDRVLRPGVAYEFQEDDSGEGIPIGLLKAKTAIVFNTSNTNKEREENIFLDPLETLWKNCIFYLCGIKVFYRKMFRIMVTCTQEERESWLDEVKQTTEKYFNHLD